MKRPGAKPRALAALQLRSWDVSGAMGLGDVAWAAVERAAQRYGFSNASHAAHAFPPVMRDLFSEAIEDLESPD